MTLFRMRLVCQMMGESSRLLPAQLGQMRVADTVGLVAQRLLNDWAWRMM